MMLASSTALSALFLVFFSSGGADIVVRHDRDEARYHELGERYGSSLALVRARDEQGIIVAEGTVIGARHVLTAAHTARHVEAGDTVLVAGAPHRVARAHVHPRFEGREHDVAVLVLADPIADPVSLPLYRADDELGRDIVVVGRGMTGTGLTGPTEDDGILHGATNRIDEVGLEWIAFAFDPPESPRVTELEGISGPGDSGGPAILEFHGTPYLVGVSSGQDDAATGGKPGRYGVVEYYTRVSHYGDWIDAIVRGEHMDAAD